MLRLVVLALLIVAVWLLLEWAYRKLLRRLGLDARGRRRAGRVGPQRPAETLVRCAGCGAYVPASRALPSGKRGAGPVCSEACRALVRRRS